MTCDEDRHFMGLALEEASKAFENGEFPVGCVIVHNTNVVASGSRSGTTSASRRPSEIDHAEIRALKSLEESPQNPSSRIDMAECTLYCTMEPCLMCFGAIMISGIKRIVYAYEDHMGGGTSCDLKTLPVLYRESEIDIVPYVMRRESLNLFAAFFARKNNFYWKNSLLEKYTLEQANMDLQ